MKTEKKQIIVIGLGRFGMSMAKTLSNYECEVLAIDNDGKLVDEAAQYVTHVAKVDAMDYDSLQSLGIRNFDTAIIGIGDNFEASTSVALALKEMHIPYIIAKARDREHEKILKMIGVNKIVEPEKDVGAKMARTLIHPNIIDSMDLGRDYSIVDIKAPKEWVGKKISELDIRSTHYINFLFIEKEHQTQKVLPTADYVIEAEDNIMLISPNKELGKGGFLEEYI